MKKAATQSIVACVTAILIFVPAVLVVLPHVTTPQEQQARQWLRSLSAQERIQWSARLSTLPLEYQKAVYTALTPAQKADLWHRRLDVLATSQTLSDAQRKVVRDATAFTTVEQFERPADFKAKGDALMQEAVNAFGAKVALDLFTHPWGRSGTTPPTLMAAVGNYLRTQFVAEARRHDQCYCSYNIYCQVNGPIGDDVCNTCTGTCTPTQDGCGFTGGSACNGACANGGGCGG